MMNIPNKLKLEHRKMRKVVVERQRRDRIERCLEHLKLILQQQQSNSLVDSSLITGSSKIEKAELLEMTVNYAWKVQRDLSQQMALGFDACVREVDAYLAQCTTSGTSTLSSTSSGTFLSTTSTQVDAKLRSQLINRLSRRSAGLRRAVLFSPSSSAVTGAAATSTSTMRAGRGLHVSSTLLTVAESSLRHDDVDSRHLTSVVEKGHVTTTRPLSDVNGNHIRSNRLKSTDECRSKRMASTTSISNIENQNDNVTLLSTSSLSGLVFPVAATEKKSSGFANRNDVISLPVNRVYDVIENDAHCRQCESTSAFETRQQTPETMEDIVWRPW